MVDINTDKVSSRTKKIDMTPIRLEGDDDDEGNGDDGDVGNAEDEDEDEESTPVPRSKRHVARYVSFSCFILHLRKFQAYLPRITYALFRKITAAKHAPVKIKPRKRKMDKKQDEDGSSDSGPSGPADSIMDSSSEEEADDEVDGMLGE
jgi:hypothetical protein